MITMYDAVDVSQLPPDAMAVAGYVGGAWPTFSTLVTQFPLAARLSIAVNASEDADCLDVESGDATPAQAPAWVHRQMARGVARPCLYASASAMAGVMQALTSAGIHLADVRLWSAHYGAGEHICGPVSCGLVSRAMDGTQWTDHALGRNLDQSLLASSFFSWYHVSMPQIPTVHVSSTGQLVRNWQGLLNAHGEKLVIDGAFGPVTRAATERFQAEKHLAVDGIVGIETWKAALTG